MSEKEFNLLHEAWILVMRPNGETEEVSILDVFRRAAEFQGLAGELRTQDIAVMRLLLAILHVVFARFDETGNTKPIKTPFDALDRWEALWKLGSLPIQIIETYIHQYEDRFYLFHPERPFYQVAGLDKGTDYLAAKMNGELLESNNKVRLFPQRSGAAKNVLSFSEATRWLLYLNAFDDASGKPTRGEKLPRPGVGWLGKLGLVFIVGDNLFETLLLNLVLLPDGADMIWGQEKPVWELPTVRSFERTEIVIPDNLSELYTIQSRRLYLKRQGNVVIGYTLLGGDFFKEENAFSEQMTTWKYGAEEERVNKYRPRPHDPSRQLWRDFPSLIIQAEGKRRPGIISWFARIVFAGIIPKAHFHFLAIAVHYNKKKSSIDDVFADDLFMNSSLFSNLGDDWVSRIISELGTTEQLVKTLGTLAENLGKAAGYGDIEAMKKSAVEQAYFNLDIPFRRWLEEIDPVRDEDNKDEKCKQWWEEEQRIIRNLGRDLIEQSSPQAFTGRELTEKIKGKDVKRLYTAPKAHNEFLKRTVTKQSLKGEIYHE
jgi:CRISPR system Cascade subunit CasA